MQVILASQSPRRRELLARFPFSFDIKIADIDETMDGDADPADEVARVSCKKAQAISRTPEDVVIAADTVVVCDGRVLGKPRDPQEATQMLELLSGRAHQVMTGLTVLHGDRCVSVTEITDVFFRPLTQSEIRRYVGSKEPMDKAGSYAIQGGAALFVEKISGDYFNVVGLPVCRLGQLLRQIAPQLLEDET